MNSGMLGYPGAVDVRRSIGAGWDGGGSAIAAAPAQVIVPVPYRCRIAGWIVAGDQAGDCTIDVWRGHRTVPTGTAYSLCRGSEIELSAEQFSESHSLPGWRTWLEPNDVLVFDPSGFATFEWLSVVIVVEGS